MTNDHPHITFSIISNNSFENKSCLVSLEKASYFLVVAARFEHEDIRFRMYAHTLLSTSNIS